MIGTNVSWHGFTGTVREIGDKDGKRFLWIITPEMWFVGIPADAMDIESIDELPPPDPESTETPREARRKAKKEKAALKRAKTEKEKVVVKAPGVFTANTWMDFRGSQALAAGTYRVLSGPYSSRSLGKRSITNEATQVCVKTSEGIYYVVLAK